MTGKKIFTWVCRAPDPADLCAHLSNGQLRRLCTYLATRPDSGVPFLIKAVAGEECERRFLNPDSNHEA